MLGRHGIRMGLCALVLAGASACAPSYDGLEVDWIKGSVGAEASGGGFSVQEGKLIVFSAKPESGRGRDYEAIDVLELVSDAPSVARVEQGLAVGTWMIMGVARGNTTLQVNVSGDFLDRIPVEVTAQEVSP